MSNQSTGRGINVPAGSIEEFNAWYLSHPKASLAVSSRQERRGGQLFGLGGLDWTLCAPDVTVTLTTAESEVLPDLPVVLAMLPERRPVNYISAVAA